jgi:hypothetical protein
MAPVVGHFRFDEAFGLAYGPIKDLADEQSGFYREIGTFPRPATGSGLGWMPCSERLLGEPDRDIATLVQGLVSFGPVGNFVTRLFRSCASGSGYVCAALTVLQVKLPADHARSAAPEPQDRFSQQS